MTSKCTRSEIVTAFCPLRMNTRKGFYQNTLYRQQICYRTITVSNKLFAGVYVCTFPPRHFTGSSSEGVKLREGDMTDGLSEVRGQSWTTLKIREGDMTDGLSEESGQSWTTLKIREGVVTEGSFEVRGQSWTTLKIGEGVVTERLSEVRYWKKTKKERTTTTTKHNQQKIAPFIPTLTYICWWGDSAVPRGWNSSTQLSIQPITPVDPYSSYWSPRLKKWKQSFILTHRMHLTTSKHKVTVFSKGPMLDKKQLSLPDSSPGTFQR